MMDSARLILSAALVLSSLFPIGNAWGQQAYAPNGMVRGLPPASTASGYAPYRGHPGSFIPATISAYPPVPAYAPNASGVYVPYFVVPNGTNRMLPQNGTFAIPASNHLGGDPAQQPPGLPGQERAPLESVPDTEPEGPDFAFDFSEQSVAFATNDYAAAPSMIGDLFGGGSTTAVIGNVMAVTLTAQGDYLLGFPGDTDALIGFDVTPPNGSIDFFSVGDALTPDGRQYNITEPLPPNDAPTNPGGGFTFVEGTATNSPVVNPTIGDMQIWDVAYSFADTTTLVIPDPGGGVVGRMKIAENASPIPRDRVFLNYSLFDNVPLQSSGVTVNRFTPGFEKTARHNPDASVEFRFPFAATLSSNIFSNGATETGAIEFGNVFVSIKKVLEKSDNWLVSGGVSLTIPTADELTVAMADGTQLVQIENKSMHVLPFLAGLTTIGERGFAQGFMQFDFDTAGNAVQLNRTGAGLTPAGKVQATNFIYLDMGMGFWIRRPGEKPDALFTSIVPTVELHINRSLQATDVITAGPFRIGEPRRSIQLNNFVVGGTVGTAGGNSMTVGYSIPFGNQSDQAFDGELRAFWNRTF